MNTDTGKAFHVISTRPESIFLFNPLSRYDNSSKFLKNVLLASKDTIIAPKSTAQSQAASVHYCYISIAPLLSRTSCVYCIVCSLHNTSIIERRLRNTQ